MTASCFDEDSDELGERARTLFQNRGYFGVEVKNVHIKLSDPIAVPKPATLEAEVLEGPRDRLAEIKFRGDHAFSAEELRGKFPLKKGDLFSRDKVGSGLMVSAKSMSQMASLISCPYRIPGISPTPPWASLSE